MGDRVLLVGAVLAEGSATGALTSWLKQRVVAEAATPARLERDPAARRPAPDEHAEPARGRLIVEGEGQRADVARAAALDGHVRELAQQLRVVVVIRGVRAGVSPRANAGCPAEYLDLDARVVGERWQAGQSGREPGLDPSVRLERQAILDRLARRVQVVERDELDTFEVEQRSELAQLVRRAGGNDEAPGGQRRTEASTVAWASKRRASPVSARSSIVSTRPRSNGRPSAVPCSSMYVPESVPTTFMSTSAWESSE